MRHRKRHKKLEQRPPQVPAGVGVVVDDHLTLNGIPIAKVIKDEQDKELATMAKQDHVGTQARLAKIKTVHVPPNRSKNFFDPNEKAGPVKHIIPTKEGDIVETLDGKKKKKLRYPYKYNNYAREVFKLLPENGNPINLAEVMKHITKKVVAIGKIADCLVHLEGEKIVIGERGRGVPLLISRIPVDGEKVTEKVITPPPSSAEWLPKRITPDELAELKSSTFKFLDNIFNILEKLI